MTHREALEKIKDFDAQEAQAKQRASKVSAARNRAQLRAEKISGEIAKLTAKIPDALVAAAIDDGPETAAANLRSEIAQLRREQRDLPLLIEGLARPMAAAANRVREIDMRRKPFVRYLDFRGRVEGGDLRPETISEFIKAAAYLDSELKAEAEEYARQVKSAA